MLSPALSPAAPARLSLLWSMETTSITLSSDNSAQGPTVGTECVLVAGEGVREGEG